MTEITIGNTNKLIDPAGRRLQLTVSQQPRLFFDATPVADVDQEFLARYVEATQTWMEGVLRYQEASRRDQFRWAETVIQISENVGFLQEQMDGLTKLVERVAAQRTFVVPLTTLPPDEPLQMRLNIPATIEGDGEDFTATFTEANVSASGGTEADAIANLKESIANTYIRLEAIPPDEMMPLPARQWSILKNVITR